MTRADDDTAAQAQGARFEESEATITLNDALKLSGFAGTGGQAKLMIQSGAVSVNGELETRRKRKLREGDVIGVGDEEFVLELESEDAAEQDEV